MVKAIRMTETGGPEVLQLVEVEQQKPGPGEVLIEQKAIGLNFIDIYMRSGLYPVNLPFTPGSEGAGVVLEVGEGVEIFKPGDRVAYCAGNGGAYSEQRVINAGKVVHVPDNISFEQAAAMILKGLTAWFLLRRTYRVQPGDTILYHAAAGGVGLLFGQWANHLGATVIGTAGSPEKMELAKAHGFHHVINYREENFVERVREITGGKMCNVVYDSVGKDTFPGSLDCLRPLGMFVSFGQSSGVVPPFSVSLLQQKGSLFVTRPVLFHYIADREALDTAAGELFDVVGKGIVKVVVNQQYKLADAGKAQDDLAQRRTSGTTILIP
ncbi:quinone oxidoreductase [Nitratireductor aestuarii]|uniref:Quinone oxidoreductase n=1 Tax=Nitratireductor aestuarii TaxID=1735103 RepID=A0A916REY0_9HYPH|nr:quinone oxidoreductase [Nitratireductor aestuarii]GGA53638.1 quinone oxidoreductase [Nitratireductor aestuarii]